MWGLLFFAVLGAGAFIHACKNGTKSNEYRNQAKKNDQKYYFDNLGKQRSVDNNHLVSRTTRPINGNWDDVMYDLTEEKVIYNYGNDERTKRQKEISGYNTSTAKKRKEAKEEGCYLYMTDKEPPIEDGEYSDGIYAGQYRKKPDKLDLVHYNRHYRRVSDNLLLRQDSCLWHPIREAKCDLFIWDDRAEKENDFKQLRKLAEHNWKKIEKWEDDERYRISWRGEKMSRGDVEAYARKINAYLPDVIEMREMNFNANN